MFGDRKPLAESKKRPRFDAKEEAQQPASSKRPRVDAKEEAQQSASSLLNAPSDVHHYLIDCYLGNDRKALGALSRSCHTFYSICQPVLSVLGQRLFLQAVIDDKRESVKKTLDENPQLLLMTPDPKMVIESQYTWQKFYAENALIMAVKRRQAGMIKLLLPYIDKLLEEKDANRIKSEALSKWSEYKEDKEGHFSIPDKYVELLKKLVDAFIKEKFPEGTKFENKFSQETEGVLQEFRKYLLPDGPVRLDDYIDTDLFLYAILKICSDCWEDFRSINTDDHAIAMTRRDHFFVNAVGFGQSLLTPEAAKKWCLGLYDFVSQKAVPIDWLRRADDLKLNHNYPFYRSQRHSVSGMGYEYLCMENAYACPKEILNFGPNWALWRDYINQKQQFFNLMQSSRSQALDSKPGEETERLRSDELTNSSRSTAFARR
jgi:hypothetical protein